MNAGIGPPRGVHGDFPLTEFLDRGFQRGLNGRLPALALPA